MLHGIKKRIDDVLLTASGGEGQFHRPKINKQKESNVPGLYVIGDLAGAPVIKLAMADGFNVIQEIAKDSQAKMGRFESDGIYDVIVVGAGASGLNAALAAKEVGFSSMLLEKEKIANTIENFPEGKWVYAEPDDLPAKGKLWLDGATKEDLVARWNEIVSENALDIRTEEELQELTKRDDGIFELKTSKGSYLAGRVVLATGQRGNPRKLGVPGESQERVYHRLYSPKKYEDKDILVVGGGNSAIEAALTLSEQNRVVLSYRKGEFSRIFQDNRMKLEQAIRDEKITVIFNSSVKEFKQKSYLLDVKGEETRELPMDNAFILIGADLPIGFLKKLGIHLENEWNGSLLGSTISTLGVLGSLALYADSFLGMQLSWLVLSAIFLGALIFTGKRGNRYSWLGISFLVWYTIYGVKVGKGQEFWPFTGWGYELLSIGGRPWSFWYTVIYTGLMTVFGVAALKRWGIDRRDRFQVWRYVSLLSFQWIMFFLVPEYLFQYAVQYQWVGSELANDPSFADQAWRSYGLVYAWPLFFYTFFYDPHQIWIVWGVFLSFVIIPILVLFQGKRYCSWICGCGGLAETFGDQWRHFAPKGKKSIAYEWMGGIVLVLAALITVAMLIRDTYMYLYEPAEYGIWFYRIVIDVWLVGILPVTLYPFLGGKVWCRYWCPLAKMMQYCSKFFAKTRISRFRIEANDKCIACGECSRYCQVGIDVMSYSLKQDVLDNETSSCIGCGICVSVCPMDVLTFGKGPKASLNILPS